MPDVYNAIKEIETTEISKLQKIVDGYKSLKNLLIELQHKSQNKEKLKPYITKLEKLLTIYEKIFEIVGENAEKYVHEEIGVSFEKNDDEITLAKKLLQFVANDAFFALREKFIIATAEYNELNQLLMDEKLAENLDNSKAMQNIPTLLINCTQLAVQFSLLVQALEKQASPKEKSALSNVITPLITFAATVAGYANEKTRDTESKKAEIILLDTLTPTDSEKSTAHIIVNPEFKLALEKTKQVFETKIQTLKTALTAAQQTILDELIVRWPTKLKNQTEIDNLIRTAGKNAEALITTKDLRSVGQAIDLIFLSTFPNKKQEITTLLDQYTQNQIKLDEITIKMEKLERDPVFKAKRQCAESKATFLSLLPQIFELDSAPKPNRVQTKPAYEAKPYEPLIKDSPRDKKRSQSFIGRAMSKLRINSSSIDEKKDEVILTRSNSPTTPRRDSDTISLSESTSTEISGDTPSNSPPSSHKKMLEKLTDSSEIAPSPKPALTLDLSSSLAANKVTVGFVSGTRTYASKSSPVSDAQPSSSSAPRENVEQVIAQGGGSLTARTASLNLGHVLGNMSPRSPRK